MFGASAFIGLLHLGLDTAWSCTWGWWEIMEFFFTSLPATMGPTRIAIRWSKIYQASTFCVRPILALPKMLYIYIMDALTRQRQERRINKRINNYLNGAISF
jgi:hypothetical protein